MLIKDNEYHIVTNIFESIRQHFNTAAIITLVVRHPTDIEAEVFVSNEPNPYDYSDLIKMIKRSEARKTVKETGNDNGS